MTKGRRFDRLCQSWLSDGVNRRSSRVEKVMKEVLSLPSVLLSFAEFLRSHEYTTSMWENSYTSNDVNQVCHHLTQWAQTALGLEGEFIVLWSRQEGMHFQGDNELCYLNGGTAYLLPNPFIEGDAEGFVLALQGILHGDMSDLYETPVASRVLYNAV